MKTKSLLLLLLVWCTGRLPAESTSNDAAPAIAQAEHVIAEGIMEINGWTVPTDWFLHEFRSTYFRYSGATDIRHAVFNPFKNRMILHAKAKEQGIDQDPELIAAIEKRTQAMRSFMEYQLEMVKIDMINEVLVKEMGINVSPESLTEEQLGRFYDENIKPRPGAPEHLSEVPAHIMDTLRAQAAQAEMERQLALRIRDWETNMVIRVNEQAVESVPVPDMKGSPPPGMTPR